MGSQTFRICFNVSGSTSKASNSSGFEITRCFGSSSNSQRAIKIEDGRIVYIDYDSGRYLTEDVYENVLKELASHGVNFADRAKKHHSRWAWSLGSNAHPLGLLRYR